MAAAADCGLRAAGCGLRTADCGLRTAAWARYLVLFSGWFSRYHIIQERSVLQGKYRLRDCTWKLAQPWPEHGPKMANNSPEIRDYSEMLKRLFRDYFWPNRPLLHLPSLLVFITIANDLFKMLTGFLQALITLFL